MTPASRGCNNSNHGDYEGSWSWLKETDADSQSETGKRCRLLKSKYFVLSISVSDL